MTVWRPSTTPEDVIMHSAKGTTWKNHKYLKKIGNAYVYAKAAKTARKKAKEAMDRHDDEMNGAGHNAAVAANEERNRLGKNVKSKSLDEIRDYPNSGHGVHDYGGSYTTDMKTANKHLRRAGRAFQEREMYERSARSYDELSKGQLKSLANDIKSDIKSIGKKKKKKSTKSKTRSTITDTFTGKTRSAKKPTSAADTINIKQLSEKNKKKRRR